MCLVAWQLLLNATFMAWLRKCGCGLQPDIRNFILKDSARIQRARSLRHTFNHTRPGCIDHLQLFQYLFCVRAAKISFFFIIKNFYWLFYMIWRGVVWIRIGLRQRVCKGVERRVVSFFNWYFLLAFVCKCVNWAYWLASRSFSSNVTLAVSPAIPYF